MKWSKIKKINEINFKKKPSVCVTVGSKSSKIKKINEINKTILTVRRTVRLTWSKIKK